MCTDISYMISNYRQFQTLEVGLHIIVTLLSDIDWFQKASMVMIIFTFFQPERKGLCFCHVSEWHADHPFIVQFIYQKLEISFSFPILYRLLLLL